MTQAVEELKDHRTPRKYDHHHYCVQTALSGLLLFSAKNLSLILRSSYLPDMPELESFIRTDV